MTECDEITRKDFNLVRIALQRKIDKIIVIPKSTETATACYPLEKVVLDAKIKERMIEENIKTIMNLEYNSRSDETVCEFRYCRHSHMRDRTVINDILQLCEKYQKDKLDPQLLEQQSSCIKRYISEMMPSHVQEPLEKMDAFEKLVWCAYLLINFHSGDECCEFMSRAYQFILKVLYHKIRRSNFYQDTDRMCSAFEYLIWRIQNNNCHAYVVVNALKVFHPTEECKTLFFRDDIDMEYVLERSQMAGFNLFQFFGRVIYMKNSPFPVLHFSQFFWNNLRTRLNFKTLLQFGVVDYCNSQFCKDIREASKELLNPDPLYSGSVRSCYFEKTFDFFFEYRRCGDRPSSIFTKAVKYLWAAIPEPYFIFSDIALLMKTSIDSDSDLERNLMMWQWYNKEVVNGEMEGSSPRSLLHLTRCVIRSCLVVNFKLPNGVESLHLPQTLKDYLQLKECELETIQ